MKEWQPIIPSILASRIHGQRSPVTPITRQATVHGVTNRQTRVATNTHTLCLQNLESYPGRDIYVSKSPGVGRVQRSLGPTSKNDLAFKQVIC